MVFVLPFELALMVAEHVNDPKALFNLSLVNHAWHNAAKLVLRKVHVSIDWTDPTRDSLSQMLAGPTQGSMIRSLMIIFPNHPCLNVNGGRGKHSTGYGRARYHSFKKYVLETVPRIPELRYLTVHFRPPRESLGPFRYTQKDKLLAHTFLIDAISKILLERSDIRELSIQGLPIYARFPNSNRSYSHPEHDTNVILAKQRLQAFKIGLVANDVWAPSPRVGSDEDPNASPQALTSSQEPELPIPVEKIIKGPPISPWSSRNTLRHISLTSWGFYQKLRTPSRGVDRNIHTSFFPALESLELRGFGINNDSSMHGWIFASKLTLRSLKLIDCAIIHQMVDCHDADLELGRNNEVTPQINNLNTLIYVTRWNDLFYRFERELNLTHFQFGSDRVRAPGERGPVFAADKDGPPIPPPKFLFGLFDDRYLIMQSKYCWTLVPPQVPQEDMSDHDEKDLIALKRLMQKIGQDWKQDDVSNHAAYVKGGLGFVQESRGALRRQVMAKVVHRVSTKNMSEVDVRTESTMKLKWSIAP